MMSLERGRITNLDQLRRRDATHQGAVGAAAHASPSGIGRLRLGAGYRLTASPPAPISGSGVGAPGRGFARGRAVVRCSPITTILQGGR